MSHHRDELCCGTTEESKVWYSYTDNTGIVCSLCVWMAMLFTWGCTLYFYFQGNFNVAEEVIVSLLLGLAMWSHVQVVFSDPGAVPKCAQPYNKEKSAPYTMCGRCDAYKPPRTHHDRVSNRCIVRMDHYCPWTNNAIGAGNQKMFILFIIYLDLASLYLYSLVAIVLVFCDGEQCDYFTGNSVIFARILLFLLLFSVLFTTSMILNQVYGLATGLGTIDRMKLKKGDFYVENPVPLNHVFGDDVWFYWLPTAPVFTNRNDVFGYCILDDGDDFNIESGTVR